MPAAGACRPVTNDKPSAIKASKRPSVASPTAIGNAAASAGTYSGWRTMPSTMSRVICTVSLEPVTGCLSTTPRGSDLSIAAHLARSCG